MTASLQDMRGRIEAATELRSVVRTMKAMAASAITGYERSLEALNDYLATVEQGLTVGLRGEPFDLHATMGETTGPAAVVLFGTDQGLVGRFNDSVVTLFLQQKGDLPQHARIYVVGERLRDRMEDAGQAVTASYAVPGSTEAIGPLVGRLLMETGPASLHVLYNGPTDRTAHVPVIERPLPLDEAWMRRMAQRPWPRRCTPEVLGDRRKVLGALVREYVFVSVFRACSASLAAENASRLAAMQRAERNIGSIRDDLQVAYDHLRQEAIDEELFDVVSGSEMLRHKDQHHPPTS
ncbi:MAG: F0F1 ATP synthase subunit gamma [Flavobacteriales bacterium]|nr:F0F1 ATP synthase subunit gamma [Flavobacteriales bacterium]